MKNVNLLFRQLFLTVLYILLCGNALGNDSIFRIQSPDFTVSPYTGLTRKHWFDAAQYLLNGAFSQIKSINDPLIFPKQPGVSYPQNSSQISTEKLEGLSRTLFVAAPLLKHNPDLTINNIKIADYYLYQLKQLCNPESNTYIKHRSKNGGPHQNLVEFGAISISMTFIPEILWEPLSKTEKDSIAGLMLSYADGPTVDSNWKFFNVFVLSFFKKQGYQVNELLLTEYLHKILNDYHGDGWYNDHPAYDYYSMWAFQLYSIIWTQFYGDRFYPDIAAKFRANFSEMDNIYPYMFSADGKMNMYGRSISYRFASVATFPFTDFQKNTNTNWGWLRMISSSTLLQFLQSPAFLSDDVPTLGFYGPFEPAVQMYSCRGSVYWSGKIFLGLFVPANSPFWTNTENNGKWSNMKKDSVYQHYSATTGILVTNYPAIGASEIRSWCHADKKSDWQKFRSSENYNRLSYNTAFPWQADGAKGEVAMNYVLLLHGVWEPFRLYSFKNFENGIYYRNVVMESDTTIHFSLAEIMLPNGIIRIDKLIYTGSQPNKEIQLRLGHYALPQIQTAIKVKSYNLANNQVATIDNGKYTLAMILWKQWGKTEIIHTTGLHPENKFSTVINASDIFNSSRSNEKIYITAQLWKKSGENWTKNELQPIQKVIFSKDKKSVTITLSDGNKKIIVFK